MSKPFYSKLAAINLKKNGGTYFPYLLTSVCAIVTFYTMDSIARNPGLAKMPGADSLSVMLNFGSIIIGLFSVILLFYTNGFLMKRRKKELGLYSILGMEKIHIAKVLFFETLFLALISLIFGLFFGIAVSKLLFLLLLNIVNLASPIAFTISTESIATTVILFGVIFLLTLFSNFWHIKIANPIALLQGGKQGEREPKTKWLLALIGFLALGAGYYISLTVPSPIEAMIFFFLAVLLVIIGTYCLFTAGSIAILKLLRGNKGFYYKPKNFISVSGMIYRMKQNAVGLASICILCTMVLVTVSTTVSLYIGQNDILQFRMPHDMKVTSYNNTENAAEIEKLIQEKLPSSGLSVTEHIAYRKMDLTFLRTGQISFASEIPEGYSGSYTYYGIMLIPLADYNQIQGGQDSLNAGEAIVFTNSQSYGQPTISIGGTTFQIKKELQEFRGFEKYDMPTQEVIYVIAENEAVIKNLVDELYSDSSLAMDYVSLYDFEGTDEAKAAFTESLSESMSGLEQVSTDCRPLMQERWFMDYGGFLFLGIFLGFLFLMATVLIIYYKQISEGYDDHDRFEIMQKVGMSRREVKNTIHKQIVLVFFLPLLGAILHIAFAFPVISKLLMLFGLTNTSLFLACTAATVLLFGLVYAAVYGLTARAYYQLVQRKQG